jgi:LAGLIDADG endonuclease
MTKHNQFLNNPCLMNPHYLAPFFLGLFEAGGGIYFNKSGGKYCAYFLLKLEPHPENKTMLECINKYLQLKASIHHQKATKKNLAKLVMRGGSKHTMCHLFCIVEKYGLLTSKKIILFRTLKQSYVKHSILNSPTTVDKNLQNQIIKHNNQTFVKPSFFCPWLSGFLEYKVGAYYAGNDSRVYFTVIDDMYLIMTIKQYFQSHHKIIADTSSNRTQQVLYRLTMTSRPVLNKIMAHFETYPLLGYQQVVYGQFCENLALTSERNRHSVPALSCGQDLKKDYFEPFFVGLLEGDGSIHLGRTKSGNLSYGVFQISLKYNAENHAMLALVEKYIGGTISLEKPKKGNDKIKWVALDQGSVKRILTIFETYPLLTSRKISQLNYLKMMMNDRSWSHHLDTRDFKYTDQQKLIEHYKQNFVMPYYFSAWISGFFEAEGCFRCTHGLSVYLCQNEDWYLLNAVKRFFQSHHKLSLHKDVRSQSKHFRVSFSGKRTLDRIIAHFESYPLLGYKKVSYDLFCNKFKQNKSQCHAVSSL